MDGHRAHRFRLFLLISTFIAIRPWLSSKALLLYQSKQNTCLNISYALNHQYRLLLSLRAFAYIHQFGIKYLSIFFCKSDRFEGIIFHLHIVRIYSFIILYVCSHHQSCRNNYQSILILFLKIYPRFIFHLLHFNHSLFPFINSDCNIKYK